MRRGLARTVTGFTITDCQVANAKVLRGQPPGTLRERVIGCHIESIARRGKYLIVRLVPPRCSPEPLSLYIHLKMRGQIAVEMPDSEPGKYLCVTLAVEETGGESRLVRFRDAWTWGEMRALYEGEVAGAVPALALMGPEPLTAEWTGGVFAEALARRRTAIKPTLLDQSVVAGVGNIYADEALYTARIHPERAANSLDAGEAERLADAIKAVLTEAVESRGTTSDNFFDVAGDAGGYTPRVYDRGGQPCDACGAPLTRIRLAGRSAVFCGVCQPPPP